MSTSNTLTTDFTIQLRDGRTMGAAMVGPSDGFPIFHCHGSGSSRLEVHLLAAKASAQEVRLIGLDRPGIGHSDPKTGYRLLDWPDDVVEVADRFGIERFAVEGISAGGPYALACAYKIPHRLTSCGLIAPATGPYTRLSGSRRLRVAVWMISHLPWLVAALVRLGATFQGSDEASIEKRLLRNAARLGSADQKLLSKPQVR